MLRSVIAGLVSSVVITVGCSSTPPVPPPPPPPPTAAPITAPAPPLVTVPPIWMTPEAVAKDCQQHLAAAASLRENLIAAADPSAKGTLEPVNEILLEVDRVLGLAELMGAVHPDKSVREAAETCQQQAQKFAAGLELDRQVYDALAAVKTEDLDPSAKRFVERLLRDYRRAGVDRDEKTRNKLAAIHEQLVKVGQDFNRTIREDKGSILATPQQLKGLPKDYLDKHPPQKDGKIRITTDYPDMLPLLSYADDEKVRRALWLEQMNRAYPANEANLKKLLQLRYDYATTLGFSDWASYNAGDKMLDDKTKVAEFIDKVAAIARPKSEKELKDLLARKKKDNPRASKVRSWDRFYYVGKLQKERFGVDPQEVRPYFSYAKVRDGVLAVNEKLFGVTFRKIEDAPVWHPSVDAFDMLDDGKVIARFYLDMHPRDGKYGHAAAFNMLSGAAGQQLPSASLVCNFPDPADGGPALMEHRDVTTFFHEFGHLMHHLLSGRHPWVTFSAFNVEWDFVEMPSQLLEEWAWDPAVLQQFAIHHLTHKPIDAGLVAKMRAADEFGKGVRVTRQMYLAALSLGIYDKPPSKVDLLETLKTLRSKYSPYPYEEGSHFFANFGHLEGYSSIYYTYMWSLVLVKDVFTKFQKAGLMDQPTAHAYRDAVLVAGASRDATDMVTTFLGRPYAFDAFKAWLER